MFAFVKYKITLTQFLSQVYSLKKSLIDRVSERHVMAPCYLNFVSLTFKHERAMNYSVTKRRDSRRSKLPVKHLAQLFKGDSRVDVSLLVKFQEELELDVVEIRASGRRIVYV